MSNFLESRLEPVWRVVTGFTLMVIVAVVLGARSACAAPDPTPRTAPRMSVMMAIQLDSQTKGRHVVIHPVVVTASGTRGTIRVDDRPSTSSPAPRREPFLASVSLEPTILESTTPRQIRLRLDFTIDNNGHTLKKSFTTTVVSGQPWSFDQDDPDLGETCRLEVTATAVGPDEEIVKDPVTGKHVVRRRGAK